MLKISFVIPCYKSENTICSVVNEIQTIMDVSDYDYEIILVNDGSPDDVWNIIEKLVREDVHIIGVDLSKNFGQASAVMAGYSQTSGDYIITLDDDGQSPIDSTLEIIKKIIDSDADAVIGVSIKNRTRFFRRIGSDIARLMQDKMFSMPANKRAVSFYIIKKHVLDKICEYTYPYTYIFGLIYRTTSRIEYLEVKHRSRENGRSGYSFKKLLGVWLNGFTAFSIKPLRFASITGMIVALAGFFVALVTFIRKCIGMNVSVGWSSIVCILLILGGLNLLVVGMVGEYIGRIYMCINKAPQYVISKIKKL